MLLLNWRVNACNYNEKMCNLDVEWSTWMRWEGKNIKEETKKKKRQETEFEGGIFDSVIELKYPKPET